MLLAKVHNYLDYNCHYMNPKNFNWLIYKDQIYYRRTLKKGTKAWIDFKVNDLTHRQDEKFEERGTTLLSKKNYSKHILYRNIQGAKKQEKGEIDYLMRKNKPNIVIIVETLGNEDNTLKVIKKHCLYEAVFSNPPNHQGGMWLLWNNDNLNVKIIECNHRIIFAEINEFSSRKNFIPSGMYEPTKENKKDQFWNKHNQKLSKGKSHGFVGNAIMP